MARAVRADSSPVSDDGDRVRRRRERLGWGPGDLAREAKVDRNTVYAVEQGRGSRRSLTKIENALAAAEAEVGIVEDVEDEREPGVVVFTVGEGPTRVAVSGPVANIDELREAAERLMRAMGESQ